MNKIKVDTPLVELDGDEMTKIIWKMIKDYLVLPYLDIDLKYYDLWVEKRDETDDKITLDAAEAIKKYWVWVKCATITPNADRVKEYNLKHEWKSPNWTLRSALDGTVFRKPIIVKNIEPAVRSWKNPITIARHAYGDVYKNVEFEVSNWSKAELVISKDWKEEKLTIHEFKWKWIVQWIHNTEDSIRSFAKACITFSLSEKIDLWFSTKDTISKKYHAKFRDIFQEEVDLRAEDFKNAWIEYFYTLIDDIVARIMHHEGNILWACMNYDWDVMSDMVASWFWSLWLMTSVLVSPLWIYEFEAAHWTVQRHYYKHLKWEQTSTNSTASIFAWSWWLKKRGELDKNNELMDFANKIEQSVIECIESWIMTWDLARISTTPVKEVANTEDFIKAVAGKLEEKMKN